MRESMAWGTLSTACMASRSAVSAAWHAVRLAATSSRSPMISSNSSSLRAGAAVRGCRVQTLTGAGPLAERRTSREATQGCDWRGLRSAAPVQGADEVLLQAPLHVEHQEVHDRLGHAVLQAGAHEGKVGLHQHTRDLHLHLLLLRHARRHAYRLQRTPHSAVRAVGARCGCGIHPAQACQPPCSARQPAAAGARPDPTAPGQAAPCIWGQACMLG